MLLASEKSPRSHLHFPQCGPRASKVHLLVILIEFRKSLYKIPKRESAQVRLGICTSLSYFLEYFDNALMLLSPSSFFCLYIPQRRKERYSCALNKDTSCLLESFHYLFSLLLLELLHLRTMRLQTLLTLTLPHEGTEFTPLPPTERDEKVLPAEETLALGVCFQLGAAQRTFRDHTKPDSFLNLI